MTFETVVIQICFGCGYPVALDGTCPLEEFYECEGPRVVGTSQREFETIVEWDESGTRWNDGYGQ